MSTKTKQRQRAEEQLAALPTEADSAKPFDVLRIEWEKSIAAHSRAGEKLGEAIRENNKSQNRLQRARKSKRMAWAKVSAKFEAMRHAAMMEGLKFPECYSRREDIS